MPRITRAALRAEEELHAAGVADLPTSALKERMPLSEISDNRGVQMVTADIETITKCTGQSSKQGKKGRNKATFIATESPVVVHEDDDKSQDRTDPAAELASCVSFSTKGNGSLPSDEASPSLVVGPATKQLHHESPVPRMEFLQDRGEDLDEAASRRISQSAAVNGTEIESHPSTSVFQTPTAPQVETKEEDDDDDSFLEQIRTRTPAKRSSRIEDSVVALDALEEEIEQVGKELPARESSSRRSGTEKINGRMSTARRITPLSKRNARPSVVSNPPKSTSTNPSGRKPPVRTDDSQSGSKASRSAQLERSSFSASEQTKVALEKSGTTRRVSVLQKAPFQPLKSTKAPTRAAFELPGEAVAQKLKEQREQRQRRDEEDKEGSKTNAFKARPVRQRQAPEVKLTTAVKARLSLANSTKQGAKAAKPIVAADGRVGPMTAHPQLASGNSKRSPNFKLHKYPKEQSRTGSKSHCANMHTKRGDSLDKNAIPAIVAAKTRPVSHSEELAHQKLRGKEVFSRAKNCIMEKDKARKDKEDATRKARIDAAERGRIASREWAEKQRSKKMADGKGRELALAT